MNLIQYIREHNGKLTKIKEADMNNVIINHTYKGNLFGNIEKLMSEDFLFFVKNNDIKAFQNGKNDITFYSVKLEENYHHTYRLTHRIFSYANGRVIDELKDILTSYHPKEYSLISVSEYGQFFEYLPFTSNQDYVQTHTEEGAIEKSTLTIFNPDIKKRFQYVLSSAISISDTLEQIDSLKASEDVLFVHHGKGVGYAARTMETLEKIAGNTYENFLIEE